jgi:hypothetical protein
MDVGAQEDVLEIPVGMTSAFLFVPHNGGTGRLRCCACIEYSASAHAYVHAMTPALLCVPHNGGTGRFLCCVQCINKDFYY